MVFFSASFLFVLDFSSFESALTNVIQDGEEKRGKREKSGDKQLTFFMLASDASPSPPRPRTLLFAHAIISNKANSDAENI